MLSLHQQCLTSMLDYRMHLGLDEFSAAEGFNRKLARLVQMAHR